MKNKRLRKLIRICMAALCSLSLMFVFDITSFADSKVYLENHFVNNLRIQNGFIQNHANDSITYVSVISGVTYYSDLSGLMYSSDSLSKDSFCVSISFPFVPESDGYILINDFVDGTPSDLKVYYFSSEGGPDEPDDPENPDDPDNPGGDVSGNDMSAVVEALNITNGKLEKLINHYVPSGEYVRGSEQLLNPVEYEFYDLLKIIAVSSVCINAFLLIIIFRRR